MNVGTILRRREPKGDSYDRLRITGLFNTGENGMECVLAPVDEFGQSFLSAVDSLTFSEYEVEHEGTAEEQFAPWSGPVV